MPALALAGALGLAACAGGPATEDRHVLSPDAVGLREPVEGGRVSRPFGVSRHPIFGRARMHRGVDFVAPRGTPVKAAAPGEVIEAHWKGGGFGRYIRIRHAGGLETAYAHLSRIAGGVAPGARVEAGQVIGYSGSSGLTTGPHLHYEVWRGEVAIDPASVHPGLRLAERPRRKASR